MILGISGFAASGKDAVASFLVKERGFKRLAYADSLKAVAVACNPELREAVQEMGWDEAKRIKEHREFLQDLGVGCRDHINPDVWVNALFTNITMAYNYDDPGPSKWVIPDVRFPNEYGAIKAHGGQVWRVTRPGFAPVNHHISESAINSYIFDQHIPNDGSLADLRDLVLGLVDLLFKETLT